MARADVSGKMPTKKKVSLSNALLSPPRASRPTTFFFLSLSLSLSLGIIEKPRGWWWWWWWSFLSVETRARALLRPDSMRMYIIMGQKRERGTLSNCLSFSSIFFWVDKRRERKKQHTEHHMEWWISLSRFHLALF